MKKEEIIKAIVKSVPTPDGGRYRKDEVLAIINQAIQLTKQSLQNRDKVVFRSFGTFVVRHKNSKEMFNVHTGEKIMTREKDHVAFIQSKEFNLI